jgi:hypothetical protein
VSSNEKVAAFNRAENLFSRLTTRAKLVPFPLMLSRLSRNAFFLGLPNGPLYHGVARILIPCLNE